MTSVEGDTWLGHPLHKDPQNLVYVDISKTTMYAKVLDSGKILLRCTIHADPKMPYIPKSLINLALQKCCMVFLNYVESKSQNLDDKYH